jgi:hypothetical protein
MRQSQYYIILVMLTLLLARHSTSWEVTMWLILCACNMLACFGHVSIEFYERYKKALR